MHLEPARIRPPQENFVVFECTRDRVSICRLTFSIRKPQRRSGGWNWRFFSRNSMASTTARPPFFLTRLIQSLPQLTLTHRSPNFFSQFSDQFPGCPFRAAPADIFGIFALSVLHFLTAPGASATRQRRKRLLRDLSGATLSRGQKCLILGSGQEAGRRQQRG